MKSRIAALLTAASLAGAVSAAVPGACHAASLGDTSSQLSTRDSVGQQLIASEKSSWELAIKHEAAAYKALHAPDFITLTGHGVVDKASSETSAMDPNVRFDRCDLSGFDVRFLSEDAALVTYHVKAAGLDHGKPFQLESYASSVWMKRPGAWMNVFYQATPASAR